MIGAAATILFAIALAAVQTGLVASFAPPVALLSLPLIAIVAEISRFRPDRAMLVAATVGLVADLLVSPTFGAEAGILLLVTYVLTTLFTRIFTNSSLPALLALNLAGFIGLHLLLLLRDCITFTLSGYELSPLFGWDRLLTFCAALGIQMAAVIIATVAVAAIRKVVGSMFVLR